MGFTNQHSHHWRAPSYKPCIYFSWPAFRKVRVEECPADAKHVVRWYEEKDVQWRATQCGGNSANLREIGAQKKLGEFYGLWMFMVLLDHISS